MQQLDALRLCRLLLDGGPEALEKAHVGAQRLFVDPLGSGAGDEASMHLQLLGDLPQRLLQSFAFRLVLHLLRDAERAAVGHVDQIAGRDGEVGGEPCALGSEGVLHHLHHHVGTFPHQLGDVQVALAVAGADVGGLEEGGARQPCIHEGGLHARQHATDLALVDVAHQAPAGGAFYEHLLHHPVLDQCHAGLGRGDVDQDLFAHGDGLFERRLV